MEKYRRFDDPSCGINPFNPLAELQRKPMMSILKNVTYHEQVIGVYRDPRWDQAPLPIDADLHVGPRLAAEIPGTISIGSLLSWSCHCWSGWRRGSLASSLWKRCSMCSAVAQSALPTTGSTSPSTSCKLSYLSVHRKNERGELKVQD